MDEYAEWDQETNTIESGKALKAFVDNINNNKTFPRKSLLMHSMGNHVIFNGACKTGAPDVQFDNIFMIAAVSAYKMIMYSLITCNL